MIKREECYKLIEWPEIQDYMDYENFKEEVGFDPVKNVWYVPKWLVDDKELELESAMKNLNL